MPSYTYGVSEWERSISLKSRTKVTLGGGRLAGHLAWGHNFNTSIAGQMVAMCAMSELSNTTDSGRSISNSSSLGKEVKWHKGRRRAVGSWNLPGDLGNSICLNGTAERILND